MSHPVRKTCKGFTLMEMLVSLFIFMIIMASVAQIFSTAYSGFRVTRNVEHDIENAQYAINIIAKELRTGSVVSASGNQSAIQFYDHSQGKCFRYWINANALKVASAASASVANCSGQNFVTFAPISTGKVSGSFRVTPSASTGGPPTRVGQVTIALEVAESTAHKARIQTTISLRDFGNIGL